MSIKAISEVFDCADMIQELYDLESTWMTKAYNGEMSLADACSGLKAEADALLAK